MKPSDNDNERKLKQFSSSSTLVSTSKTKVETFAERLGKIISKESVRSFALKTNLTPAAFHKYIKGQSEPTRPVLVTISNIAGVNLEWLATGNGPMLKTDAMAAPAVPSQPLADSPITNFTVTDFQGRQLDFKPDPNLIHIPVLSLEAACGMGTFGEDAYITSIVSATEDWFRLKIRKDPHNMCLIHATGDSMEPLIEDGDMVFFDRTTRNHPCDGIWVFSYEDNLFLKRLQFLPDNKIKIISSNKAYEPYIITINESFHLFGRYVAVLGVRI